MKIFFVLAIVAGLISLHSQTTVSVKYRVTNKAQLSPGQLKSKDPVVNELVQDMMNQIRIVSEFQLTSNELETNISRFQLQGRNGVTRGPFIFRNDQWFGRDLSDTVQTFSIICQETKETKMILGYNCRKWIGTINDTNSLKVQIWATENLPSKVNPIIGLRYFPYGILEGVIGDSAEVYEAVSVEMVDNKKAAKVEKL